MSAAAWFCPSCQKHHAPHVDTCPSALPPVSFDPFRFTPFPPKPSDPRLTAAQAFGIGTQVWNGKATTPGDGK